MLRRGLSLIEVVASTMIVGMMAVAALNSLGAATRSADSIGNRAVAIGLADELMSEILQTAYSDPSGSHQLRPGKRRIDGPRSAFDDVDDYDGWNESPPKYRDGTHMPDRADWRQRVQVTACRAQRSHANQRHRSRRQADPVTIEYRNQVLAEQCRRPHRIPIAKTRMQFHHALSNRKLSLARGGVYIAVLGTALLVALLGMTALVGQRMQNRMVTASADIRQAQLNANTAVELALLTMKQDANWRTS